MNKNRCKGALNVSLCSHQVTKVAHGVPGQLYDAFGEPAVVVDESGEDGGQAMPGSVQHDGGGPLDN